MTKRRVLISLCLLALVVVAPYWIYLPALVLAIALFPFFIEGVILGLLIDALYGAGAYKFFILNFPFAIGAVILVFTTPLIRKRLRFNA